MPQCGVGIAERQTKQREEPAARFRHDLFGEPAIIGPAQLDLHFRLRMHSDVEHAGREQAGIVDAHGVHPAMAELHIADLAVLGLLAAAHRVARHPAAHVLIAGRHRYDTRPLFGAAAGRGELAQHVVFHVRQELVVVLVLVMMGVDVDDQDVVEFALMRLLARVREQARGVELLDRYAAAAIGYQVHCRSPDSVVIARSSLATCRARTRRGWQPATIRSP